MKKFLIKNQIIRIFLEKFNKKYFILKSIIKNKNLFLFVRKKSFLKLKSYTLFSYSSVYNKCILTFTKKTFNKYVLFSRFVYLKLIQNGQISGIQKSNW